MDSRKRRFLALALAALCGCVALDAQPPARSRHVVVVSLDGFPVYALDDPTIPLPNLRALIGRGTRATAMIPVNPTVTWPNHTSMMTGVSPARHGLIFNGMPVRTPAGEKGDPVRIEPHVNKAELVLAPTVYDLAFAAGLTTAQVDWVAIENAPTITWAFPEYSHPEAPLAREMVRAGVVTDDELATFAKAPITFRDEIWTRAGEFILERHRPNLLLFHLLTTDSVQHQYGVRSLAQQTALVLADARMGRLVEACRRAGILPTTTFLVVSDHGFKTYTQRVRPNVVLQARGLSDAAWAIAEGGTAMVYVTGGADVEKTTAAIKAAFGDVNGVSDVLTPADYPRYGLPAPETTPRMSAAVLVARAGTAFVDGVTGPAVERLPDGVTLGAHGYLNTDPDLRAILIASGAGVTPGAALGVVSTLDVAPTIAAWLGLHMPDVEGHVLSAIAR